MDVKKVLKVLEEVKKNSPKRNFTQSYDIIINLKNLDFKKPENHVDFFAHFNKTTGKEIKVCALVGPESAEESKAADAVIVADDFDKYKDKKLAKKLANEYDFFVAQANMMGKIAGVFGRVFGPRNKMPNPKAGCVVPPKANLEPLIENLHKTVRIVAKKDPVIQLRVGKEDMESDIVADNIVTIFDQTIHHLPQENNNIKSVFVKLTMGKPIKVM